MIIMKYQDENEGSFFANFYDQVKLLQKLKLYECENCDIDLESDDLTDRKERCSFNVSVIRAIKILLDGLIEREENKNRIDSMLLNFLRYWLYTLEEIRKVIEGYPL